MHILERYALSCGMPIGEAYLYEKYFPLPIEKYITIHPFSKPAKTYDFWQDVVNDIKPVLDKYGIRILQIGSKDEDKINGCVHLQGATNIGQVGYLLDKSLLHLSVDTFSAHIASHKNIPMVTLFSSSNISNCCGYWGDKNKQIFLEPKRKDGERPSYSTEENPKTINKIPSESISDSVFKLFGFSERTGYKTIEVGARYLNSLYFHNVIPNEENRPVNQEKIEVRMDLNFNIQFLENQLKSFPATIITDREIDLSLIEKFKERIPAIFVIVKDGSLASFVRSLISLGVRTEILTFSSNSEEIRAMKLSYYEMALLSVVPTISEEKVKKLSELKNLYFKSNKIYSYGEKRFYSASRIGDKVVGEQINVVGEYHPLKNPAEIESVDFDFLKIVQKSP